VLEDDPATEFEPDLAASRSRRGTGKIRRDSVVPWAGITGRLASLLTEGGEEGEGEDVKTRLETVEKTTLRIENMLQRLCDELDDGMRRSINVDAGETGRIQDLDKSGTADIDT
jgi:hypothetical protein